MFSPVHVAIYWLALPIPNSSASSPVAYETHISPAAVYFTVILTQVLLSAQVIWFKTAFMQQAKDQSVISKEVMHEYDHKYVHPRLNQLKRDVSVQCDIEGGRNDFVQAFTPQFAREGFRTFANPNYADFTGQSSGGDSWMPPRPHWSTPVASTASRPTTPFAQNIRQPVFERASSRPTMSTTGIQADENTSIALADRDREGERTTRERPRSTGVGADFEAQQRQQRRMGTEGMVDWSRHNSRGLSPSKMSTPLKKGSKIRGSTYAESLGTPLGTPVKRRQF